MKAKSLSTPAFDLRRIERESFVRRVVFRGVLGSSNDLALHLAARADLPTPLLVLAEEQTAGRGRGTHRWWSPPGALTFSLVLDAAPLRIEPEHWPRVSLAAAVAVCHVLEETVPQLECGIRWPNDVAVAGRKICGILPELPTPGSESAGPHPKLPVPVRLVLGIGINVNNSLAEAPPEVQAVGVSLRDLTGQRYELTGFLLHVLERLAHGLDALARGKRQVAEAWSQRCLLQGRRVALHIGASQVQGTCHGIDHEGALLLETPRGRERFFGGVVKAVE